MADVAGADFIRAAVDCRNLQGVYMIDAFIYIIYDSQFFLQSVHLTGVLLTPGVTEIDDISSVNYCTDNLMATIEVTNSIYG
jgi:hypothetical protein